jgi:hypothetical protein
MVYKKSAKSYFILIAFLLFLCNYVLAQSSWVKYGWQIFDNAGDGRSLAMGNTAIADVHINSTLWNPAIIGVGNTTNITYGHQSRFAGIIQSDFFSIPLNTKLNKSYNLIFLHESVNKIPNTQDLLLDWGIDGVPNTGDLGEYNGYLDEGERLDVENTSYFNQHQFGIQINTNVNIYNTKIGIGVKTLFHKIGNNWGSGIGLDIGAVKSVWNKTSVGVAIRNIIPAMMIWDSGQFEMTKPQLFAGVSQLIEIQKLNTEILLLTDLIINLIDESLNDDFTVGRTGGNYRIGGEISYNNKLKLRFGRNQYGFLATGMGLSWTNFELHYAYQLSSNTADLGSNHVFSFDVNPDWIRTILLNNKIDDN